MPDTSQNRRGRGAAGAAGGVSVRVNEPVHEMGKVVVLRLFRARFRLGPDDQGYKSGKPEETKYCARQNVILELGIVLAKLGKQGRSKMEPRPDHKFSIAKRFKALRLKSLLTQSDLGRIVGVCRQTVNKIERRRVMLVNRRGVDFVNLKANISRPGLRI